MGSKKDNKKKKKAQDDLFWAISDHYQHAEWALRREDTQEAVFHLKKILHARPNAKEALRLMAEIEYNANNFFEAIYYFEKIKELGDDHILLELFLGLSYYYSCRDLPLENLPNYQKRLDLTIKNLEEFLNKTARKRDKEIQHKRQVAMNALESISWMKMTYASISTAKSIPEKKPLPEEPVETKPEYAAIAASDYQIKTNFSFSPAGHILKRIEEGLIENKMLYDLRLEFHHLLLLRGYDELVCLETLKGVDHYWYQIETVKRVLKYYRGRVLLSDEVGLGKTIEACMLIKEYWLRRLVNRVLILTPSSLVSQWAEELANKFNLHFVTTDQEEFRQSESFWTEHPLIIASLNAAKSKKHFDTISRVEYDLVVVDEAHHLRNRSTQNWKLINSLKKKFIFLISATPVQNNLIELFNLITLLKPGLLKTETEFRKKYIAPGKPKMPRDSEALRQLLSEVMVRNTRSLIDVKLPSRFATTIMVSPSPLEEQVYHRISSMVRQAYQEKSLDRFSLTHLQMRAGSSFFSLKEPLTRIQNKTNIFNHQINEILALISSLRQSEKEQRVLELIKKKPGEKKIVFTHYLDTMNSLAETLKREGIAFTRFYGDMSNQQKDQAIYEFRESGDVLLSTEIGGEGRNIQFCRTIINYDLPWNPMRIEQRIGRIHRIGQTQDVFIFNFCLKESVEEYILNILDKKINMFELVIGEIDNILGNLDEETEFSELIMDIWANSKDKKELADNFSDLGERMIQAKRDYTDSKELDETLLSTDFGM